MFIKFNEYGKVLSFADVEKIENVKPDNTGFEFVDINLPLTEIMYLEKINGTVIVNQQRKEADILSEKEKQNKRHRTVYLDAYRNYQASVNYGEFQKVPAVDVFIKSLRNKDWTALNNVPMAIKYFTGECSLAQSGLTENQV